MKKIVALVLSLVMVLGLATTAFGAITLWGENGTTVECDVYEAAYNTKVQDSVEVEYITGKALKFNADGTVKQVGVIPHYVVTEVVNLGAATINLQSKYVMVSSIPADADADDYVLVKAHDAKVAVGDKMITSQSAADAYYIFKQVYYTQYTTKATEFTAWSNDCEAYKAPADAEDVDYYTIENKTTALLSTFVKYAVDEAEMANHVEVPAYAALVGNEVVVLDADATVAATKHAWLASKWDEDGVATNFTCNTCKTVGTVVNSPVNAPAGAKLDNFGGILIAYNMAAVEAPAAGDKVESAETFDAGIAMYVGMSVMAAAGSAVVLKKKD